MSKTNRRCRWESITIKEQRDSLK